MGFISDALGAAGGVFNAATEVMSLGSKLLSLTPQGMFAELASVVLEEIAGKVGGALGEQILEAFQDASGGFEGVFGSFSDLTNGLLELGASPMDIGRMEQALGETVGSILSRAYESDVSGSDESEGEGSWLLALAKALGKQINEKKDVMLEKQGQLDGEDAGKSAEFAAAAQELNLLMTTAQNVIKTLGDGMSTLARK